MGDAVSPIIACMLKPTIFLVCGCGPHMKNKNGEGLQHAGVTFAVLIGTWL